jgi:signal transduction histidine kinase
MTSAAGPLETTLPWDIRSKQETVFSVFLLALAFLFRHHSSITYPELLYVFGGFLAFNFLYNRFLKQKAHSMHLAYSPIFVNGILITCAIHYSGGETSYLWVMYLLPIFTACLLFDGRGILLSTLYVAVLHAWVYGQGLWGLDAGDWLQFLSRTALLVLSASVTWRLAAAERAAKVTIQAQRKNYEEALRRLQAGSDAATEPAPPEGGLMARGIHDVNTALTVILGSTQLVLSHTEGEWLGREDLVRIESAVRLSKVLLQNLFLLSRTKESWPLEPASGHNILKESMEQCRGELRSRRIAMDLTLGASLDAVTANPHLLQQALTNFLFAAVVSTPVDGRVKVSTRTQERDGHSRLEISVEDGGALSQGEGVTRFFDPHWVGPGRGKGVGLGLFLGREIVRRHGGDVSVETTPEGGSLVSVQLPQERKQSASVIQLDELAGRFS